MVRNNKNNRRNQQKPNNKPNNRNNMRSQRVTNSKKTAASKKKEEFVPEPNIDVTSIIGKPKFDENGFLDDPFIVTDQFHGIDNLMQDSYGSLDEYEVDLNNSDRNMKKINDKNINEKTSVINKQELSSSLKEHTGKNAKNKTNDKSLAQEEFTTPEPMETEDKRHKVYRKKTVNVPFGKVTYKNNSSYVNTPEDEQNNYIPATAIASHKTSRTYKSNYVMNHPKRIVLATIIASMAAVAVVVVFFFISLNNITDMYKTDYSHNLERAEQKADSNAHITELALKKLIEDSASVKDNKEASVEELNNTLYQFITFRQELNANTKLNNAVSGEESKVKQDILKQVGDEISYYENRIYGILEGKVNDISYNAQLFNGNAVVDNATVEDPDVYKKEIDKCIAVLPELYTEYNYIDQSKISGLISRVSDNLSHLEKLYTRALYNKTTTEVKNELSSKNAEEFNGRVEEEVNKRTEQLNKENQAAVDQLNNTIEDLKKQLEEAKRNASAAQNNNTNNNNNGQNSGVAQDSSNIARQNTN